MSKCFKLFLCKKIALINLNQKQSFVKFQIVSLKPINKKTAMVFVTAKCTLKTSNLKPMIICQEARKDINEKQIIDKKCF